MDAQARSFVVWIVIGLIAGWLAYMVVGGAAGLLVYLIIGLLGSVVGGWLAGRFNIRINLGNDFVEQIIISTIGAIIIIIVARLINIL